MALESSLVLYCIVYKFEHRPFFKDSVSFRKYTKFALLGVQGWRSCDSARPLPMWPRFDSQIWRQMWAEFVGSLLCTERFSPSTPVSPLLKLIVNLSLQCPQLVLQR